MKNTKLKLILIPAAMATLVLSSCQFKTDFLKTDTISQTSEQSSVVNNSNDSSVAPFDPNAQTSLPDSERNDFEYVINNNDKKRFEFGKYYGFSDGTCVTRNLAFDNSSTDYNMYSLSSGLRPNESTLEDFCNLYNINSDNTIASHTRNNMMTYHYPFDKNAIKSYSTPDATSYVIIETCWSYQDGKWSRMNVEDEIALNQGKSTLSSDAILSIAIELDNETKSKAHYVFVSYGTPKDFYIFNNGNK